MKQRGLWLTLLAIATLAAVVGYQIGFIEKTAERPTPLAGSASAVMTLPLQDVSGAPQALSQWRGKILVVNYWATWCTPCRDEMPGFSRLQQQFGSKGVQFVGISTDDAAKIQEFLLITPVIYPLLIGDMNTMMKSAELGNTRQALPFTAVFDRDGNLAMSRLGRWSEADLEAKLTELTRR